jgi:hypothetical protein
MKKLYERDDNPTMFNCVIRSTLDGGSARVNKVQLALMSPIVESDVAFCNSQAMVYTVADVPGTALEALVRLEYIGEVTW